MWAYQSLMGSSMQAVDAMRAPGTHPSETFITDMLLLIPTAILLFPLQMIAEAELALFSRLPR